MNIAQMPSEENALFCSARAHALQAPARYRTATAGSDLRLVGQVPDLPSADVFESVDALQAPTRSRAATTGSVLQRGGTDFSLCLLP